MRETGRLTMALFVISLFVRLRVYMCKNIPASTGEDGFLLPGNFTLFDDASTNVTAQNNGDRLDDVFYNDGLNTTNATTENVVYKLDNITNQENVTVKLLEILKVRRTTESTETFPPEPKKELPMAMIIAGPAAAISIFLFLCIAYYFHNLQLNKKVKRLSITLYVTPDPSTESSNCDSNNGHARTHRLVPAPSPSPVPFGGESRHHSRESDIFNGFSSQRRKSIMPPPTLGVPNMNKRGSNWSALADQEILNLSAPRRHSTFIL